jgi:regulator of CtrA degradation
VTDSAQAIAYFDKTFDEAMALTREARDYLAHQKQADFEELNAVSRLVASCESMRLTARVTQVVAWLLVQKAVYAGEITREEAAEPDRRLSGQSVCGAIQPVLDAPLPERLAELLDSSLRLYQRVARLDEMLDRDVADNGPSKI